MAPTRWSTWPASPSPRAAGPLRERPRSPKAGCCRQRSLVAAINRVDQARRRFWSAVRPSATTDRAATNRSPRPTSAGDDFLGRLSHEWERAALAAESGGTRVVLVRTGLVLERDGGALKAMLPPFQFGVGGPLGSGMQYWPWIHRADWIALVRFLLNRPDAHGAVNATAPRPVTNEEFSRTLARVIRRPCVFRAPAFVLRLAMGEMADALLLSGQRVVPARAQEMGFTFEYETLEPALRAILPDIPRHNHEGTKARRREDSFSQIFVPSCHRAIVVVIVWPVGSGSPATPSPPAPRSGRTPDARRVRASQPCAPSSCRLGPRQSPPRDTGCGDRVCRCAARARTPTMPARRRPFDRAPTPARRW